MHKKLSPVFGAPRPSTRNYRHQSIPLTDIVWNVAIYGCESWTIKRTDYRLEVFAMKAH